MPTSFARSMRSLDTDGFRGAALTFACAGALLAAWGTWFVFGQLTVYEVTDIARLEVAASVHPIDARVAGHVVATHLQLGRVVQSGDVLVELDADEEHLRLKEGQTARDVLSSQVTAVDTEISAESQALESSQRAAEIARDEARSQLAAAELPARFAEGEAARAARLHTEGLISQADEARTRADAQQRRAAAESMRIAVQRVERNQRTEAQDRQVRIEHLRSDLTRLRGSMATAASAISRLENEIERRRIRAPVNGRLGEVAELRIGGFVAEGQRLGAIIPSGDVKVIAEFEPSSALGRIRVGQPGRLRLAGFPWAEYGSVAIVVENVAGEVRAGTVRVELAVEPHGTSAVLLQHGLPGAVEIEVERVSPATLVLRAGGRSVTRPVLRGAPRD